MKKNMVKAVALVSALVAGSLQASVTFYNNSDRLIRVEGFLGIMYPIQPGASREFPSSLQDTIAIRGRDSAADSEYGAYKYRVRRSVRKAKAEQGKAGERVHLKKAFFDGSNLTLEGRIGKDADSTTFMVMREPLKTRQVTKKTKTKQVVTKKTETTYASKKK